MFVSYLDFIFTHFTYFTFEIGILVFLCVFHSHGLRPCRSGKPRQGIIPCTLSASPADGRKGREIPCLSISQHPSVSLRQVLPDRYAVSVLPLDFVPAPQPNPTQQPAYTYPIPSSRSFPSLASSSSNRSNAVEPSPNLIVSR